MGRGTDWRGSPAGWARGRTRSVRPGWKALALVVLGLGTGCGARTSDAYAVTLSTATCSGIAPLEGVRYLRWRLTGAGMEPVERYTPLDEGVAHPPEVRVGPGRVLEVRGYTDLPRAGGRVVAVGRSHPFDLAASGDQAPVKVGLALRRVGEYSRPPGPEGTCGELGQARAGHTATLLEDGRVLLAGGFQVDAEGRDVTLASVEVFDPVSGRLERLPDLAQGRAFHTATRLPGGEVLLVGGEVVRAGELLRLSSAELRDVAGGQRSRVEWAHARSHHAAAVDTSGRVFVVGGEGAGGEVVAEAEGYDTQTGLVFPVATPVPRVGLAMRTLGDGQRIAVVGGSDGQALRPEVLLFAYQEGSFAPVEGGGVLREPRRDAALVPFGAGERLLYVGGYASPGPVDTQTLLASSEFVLSPTPTGVGEAPQVFARSGLCAVALPDGRVVTLGGRGFEWDGLGSDPHAELLVPGTDGGLPGLLGLRELEAGRSEHTCTVLEDGAVLVVGGVREEGSERTTHGDFFLYTPPPLE
jgi:hypothetical protein